MPRGKRPHMRGVSVQARPGVTGTAYVGRYTLATGKRPTTGSHATWEEAFEAAAAEQRKIDRHRYRNPAASRMTFTELVDDHWLPNVMVTSKNTLKNYASHLGDGTGQPTRKGGKAERAARFQLRNVFGPQRIGEIGPHEIRTWQTGMVKAGYEHGSILAKRSLLRGIFQVALVNGWIDLNPVDAVPEPPKVHKGKDRAITPAEWGVIRSRLTGETTLLLVDTTLDCGSRFGEVTALRPVDVIDAGGGDPQHLWIRRAVIWPGRKYTDGEEAWEIKDYPKGRRDRRVAVSPDIFRRLVSYIDKYGIAENALIFDYGRLRAEHAARRERDPLPTRMPHGRYVNPKTGRSGAHGRYTTYSLGCRCPFCRNAYSEYRFWWARSRGRRAAQPWLEEGFVASRATAVDPCPHQWFHASVWTPAVRDAGLEWTPTFHDLRHAMVTWSLDGGAPPRVVQNDAGHSSFRTTEVYIHRLDDRVSDERLAAMAKMYDRMDGEPSGADAAATTSDDPLRQVFATWLSSLTPEQMAEIMVSAMRRSDVPDLRIVE